MEKIFDPRRLHRREPEVSRLVKLLQVLDRAVHDPREDAFALVTEQHLREVGDALAGLLAFKAQDEEPATPCGFVVLDGQAASGCCS